MPRRVRQLPDGSNAGSIGVHDPFDLIRHLARSQSDPRKAVAELVQNALDEQATHITVERRRDTGETVLSILDDGRGVDRKPGGRLPGGWWILSEADIQLGEDGFRPDLGGWRRERMAAVPRARPIVLRPDWIAEIVSESNAAHDRVVKLRAYHRAGIPHSWLIDPRDRTLTVFRHAEPGYLAVLVATEAETVRAEPFDEVDLDLRTIFGDEDDDP